ncbi:phosphoribosyltransferase [Spiroplasma chrysopicola]|uniref:Hypoxanthine-guanine phosphoribosyltransferase n=1 Tax=Spiroplasma chrysopicola DF-1 TaxID=1276227 RepID=R4UFC5_9MOLU|nr:phosphoribosyltransferase family protein [Spiroplasma chrysopicola]AGM24840.1 hypoxanthine-guanine phosphoribosyltransferase [Spiroplasma chrysopicola DF-1]
MDKEKLELYISAEEIQSRIKAYGEKITKLYKGTILHCIGIMNGSLFFFSDLLRRIDNYIVIDTITVSSYQGINSTGEIIFSKAVTKNIENKDVLLIEDLIDTGKTLSVVIEEIKKLKPKSLRVVCLADKVVCHPDFKYEYEALFDIKDEFVVGYGFDVDDRYRQLEDIYIYRG